MSNASIFLSHNHRDKPFVRTLAQDLRAFGVHVWLDEAEIRVGDSLIKKISTVIDEMKCLGIVLSPNSVDSKWVREELEQVLTNQLSECDTRVLPILLSECTPPGFLRGKAYADFRDPDQYATAFLALLGAMNVDRTNSKVSEIVDPFAKQFNQVRSHVARPKHWHCIYCGWRCDDANNSYLCLECKSIRAFLGDSATQIVCRCCGQGSPVVAKHCEWCGVLLRPDVGATVTYRCVWNGARVVRCLVAQGARTNGVEALIVVRLSEGQEITFPFAHPSLRFAHPSLRQEYVVEEMFVQEGQLLFEGTPLAKLLRTS